MKNLVMFLLCAISLDVWAQTRVDIYCNPTISCENQTCSPMPDHFSGVSPAYGQRKDGLYDFVKASSNSIGAFCDYEYKSIWGNGKLTISAGGYRADTMGYGNQWLIEGRTPTTDDHEECKSINPGQCPFRKMSV